MAPLLIDSKDVVKLSLIAVLLVLAVFAGGFLSGYQQAAAFYLAGSEVQALSLPEHTASDENDIESQAPKVTAAGEEIDVDRPKSIIKTTKTKSTIAKSKQSKLPVGSKESASARADKTNTATVRTANTKADKTKADKTKTARKKTASQKTKILPQPAGDVDVKTADKPVADALVESGIDSGKQKIVVSDVYKNTVLSAEDLNAIKYTIQVGMYGRLVNAENMMQMLLAQQFDAYITDYTNKKSEVRYNVRFGYFSDKRSAINDLKKFKSKQKGDGYLVKFTAENIVDLADAKGLTEEVKVIKSEKKKNRVKPAAVVEPVADKLSQVTISSQPLTATN